MSTSRLRPGDVTTAAWIRPRLVGRFGTVSSTVPAGYAAYVRICHPATDAAGATATWAQVAAVTGGQPHPTMQWHRLVGSTDPWQAAGSRWSGGNPARGDLEPDSLRALLDVLGRHTDAAGDCQFGLWEGWGWVETDGPRLHHPLGRSYLLLTGPLAAATDIGRTVGEDWFLPQSPQLWWPADRSWCAATEVDLDSTLVAGSAELAAALLADPRLEAWPVAPTDSLTADADHVNT